MNINADSINNTTDIPTCITTKDIQAVMLDDTHSQDLGTYIIEEWPSNRELCKKYKHIGH